MLKEHLKPPPKVWPYDRMNTVGASEIGTCARQVWFRKNGTPLERGDGWGFQERGHVIEAWAIKRLKAAGVKIRHSQRTLVSGYLSATVDAIVGKTCVDFKSHDPRKHEIVEPRHVLQVQVQIGLWREVGRRRIEDGLLVYINASDFQDAREVPVPRDDDAYAGAQDRARAIMTGERPPPEGRIAGGRECEHCAYQTACLGAPIRDGGHLKPQERERLEVLRSCVSIEEKRIADAEASIARLRETARDVLRAADVRRVPGLVSVRRSSRTTLDQEAMERDGINLAKYRKPGRETEQVSWN